MLVKMLLELMSKLMNGMKLNFSMEPHVSQSLPFSLFTAHVVLDVVVVQGMITSH